MYKCFSSEDIPTLQRDLHQSCGIVITILLIIRLLIMIKTLITIVILMMISIIILMMITLYSNTANNNHKVYRAAEEHMLQDARSPRGSSGTPELQV